jgi:acylphosphatase
MANAAIRIVISGQVQGVGFRMWTCRQAERLGLRGWVRNRRDGRVEALLIGEASAIDTMTDACRRGPRLATVTGVESLPAEDDGTTDFAERATA